MEIPASTTATGATGTGSNRTGLADNFDNFLQLLTTQLQSQDPLAPLNATQFTEQLVQFTGVEQAIKTNDVLAQLISLVRTDQIGRAVDYLGAEVTAAGNTVRLGADGPTDVHYRLDAPAAGVVISIQDQAGRVVRTQAGQTSPGMHSVPWDGRDQAGRRLPEGLYQIEVAASTAAGDPVPVSTTFGGIVDGVELAGERLMLSVGGLLLPLDAVTSIRRPQVAA